MTALPLFFSFGPGTPELLVIGIVGLLLFGRRLPEVGRSLGKTFFQLKRGMNDIRHEFEDAERMADQAAREARWREEDEQRVRDHDHEVHETQGDEFVDPHAFLREDEEIVREAQAFGESVGEDEKRPQGNDESPDADKSTPGDRK